VKPAKTHGKLSDVRLRALLDRPPARRVELKDGTVDGLTLRVGPRGRPTWSFRFRLRGAGGLTERGTKLNGARYHRVSLGTYPDVSLKEARRKAAAFLDDVATGKNPLIEFEENAVDRRDTVAELVADFLVHAEQNHRTWKHAKWCLHRHLLPAWGERPAGSITERDAKSLLDTVAKGRPDPETGIAKQKSGAASEVRKWGLSLFRFAVEKERAKVNPFAATKPPRLAARQRFLEIDEARAAWAAAGDMREPWGQAIRLLMLTGCREMEICAARRAWFDKAKATLLIPPEQYKTGRHFLVCLPAEAVAIIDSLYRWNAGDHILSTTNGEKPIAGVPRKIVDDLHKRAEIILGRPMQRFALHDLRRTVRTHLARLSVDEVVAELVLGHALRGLRATYNLYGFAAEKRHALELWTADLLNVVDADEHNKAALLAEALEALKGNRPLSESQRAAILARAGGEP
jgi:integrase